MQKLVKAAKEGTKDGLEKTKAAVKRGRSFIKTKSFCNERKIAGFEEEESDLFIEVDCFNVEPVLCLAPDGLSQQQLVRRCILGSILESEKNYLEALKRILEQYEKPLSQLEPRLLSDRKLKMTFYRVREILQCHFLFQIALASRVAEWDSLEMIGDVFVASFSKSMVVDAYCEFVNNFSTAMAVVRKTCASKPAFLEFLKHRQETSADRVTLYGLMMKPIQRFPQFILLLQDMLKNTPVGHADRLPLQMALTELETLAERLNEKKREADQRCEIRHIAKAMNERYLNKLLSNGSRYLLRSDDMVETVYNERGEMIKTKERRLFLLNDVLMCATPNFLGDGLFIRCMNWKPSKKIMFIVVADKLYMGPGQLYQDLQNLIHDLSLVNQISSMISSLKGNYQNVNPTVAQDWVSGLQRLILKKEEEIRAADRCRIQLQLPGKQDKSVFVSVLNTCYCTWSNIHNKSYMSWVCVDPFLPHFSPCPPLFFLALRVGFKFLKLKIFNTFSNCLFFFLLQVASCTNQMGQIAIVAMQNSSPKVTECFNVESRILCMVYVPPEPPQENKHGPQAKTSETPSVCLGMEEGRYTIQTLINFQTQMLYLLIRSYNISVISSGIKASLHTVIIQSQLEAHQEEGMVVSHMVVAGVGIWIASSSGSTLRLFHTETLQHLQDINIATTVHSILPGNQRVSVSSLLVCHGLLLVGTNLGVTVALSVPRLQGIPKVTGRGMVSFHAHNGPVKFLTMAAAVCNRLSGPPPSTSSPSRQQRDSEDPESTQQPADSAPVPPQVRGLWLGEVGCTTMALQDSQCSSSCSSLTLSHASLEHSPEDGALYDVLHDPAHHQRGRRSSRVDVSSLLVVSGGLGHRRVNKKTKQSRHEDTTSTIMIWQIPLLNM
uniref:DH domain-containing protein n=1 Tax=Gouania willdenowi TaxID=441366 RepID=A0A8C5GR30_GOUWI